MAAKDIYKLPSFGVKDLLKGLREYSSLSNRGALPVHASKPLSITAADSEFLAESGLLTRVDKSYLPTQLVLDYTRDHIWNQESAASVLRPALATTWFGRETIAILRERAKVTKQQLAEWLLFQTGLDPILDKREINIIIELLEACKVIEMAADKTYSLAPGLEPYLPEAPPDPTRELLIKISTLDEDSKSKVRAFVDDLVRQQA